jgi:hypothetical protein
MNNTQFVQKVYERCKYVSDEAHVNSYKLVLQNKASWGFCPYNVIMSNCAIHESYVGYRLTLRKAFRGIAYALEDGHMWHSTLVRYWQDIYDPESESILHCILAGVNDVM